MSDNQNKNINETLDKENTQATEQAESSIGKPKLHGLEDGYVPRVSKKDGYTTSINNPELTAGEYKPVAGQPATIKCTHCGEEMPTTIDTCVCCGHYLKEGQKKDTYKPIDENKAKKIRWIVGIICVVVFIIWYATVKL
ncbi:MAG: hypothetical protein E7350_03770 [Clostridiales bacterium]|nr:hypothetical protein [Clostridiales bacterium]